MRHFSIKFKSQGNQLLVSPLRPVSSHRPVSYPENHYSVSPLAGDRGMPYRNPSASFSSPGSGFGSSALGVPGLSGPFVHYKPTRDGSVVLFFEAFGISTTLSSDLSVVLVQNMRILRDWHTKIHRWAIHWQLGLIFLSILTI